MLAAALSAGCAAVYTNAGTCEQAMRQSVSELSPNDTLKVNHAGTAIHGSRVVVEGTLEHPQTASEAAVAKPPNTNIIEAGLLAPIMAAFTRSRPQKTVVPAAVECTYDADRQTAFRWLAPARLVQLSEPHVETPSGE